MKVLFAVGIWATLALVQSVIPLGASTANAQSQVQLAIQPGVQLSWLENTNDTYHLQWSTNPSSTWTDLIAAAIGNGTTNTVFDPVPSGTRTYQLLDIVPGVPSSSSLVTNGGFESGTGSTASNWTVDTAAGGPVYGVRTNDNPHGGSYNFEVHLASTGAGPVVQFNQTVVSVTGGTTYPFTFYASALTGSQGCNAQWRILWNTGGDTGYQMYSPGNGVYASISNSVTAPAAATSATIFFHFAGAAITSEWATIDIDDVALGSGGSSPGTPAVTNVLQVASLPMAQISWPSAVGVQYFPESTTDLVLVPWTNNFPAVTGDGTPKSFLAPMTNSAGYFRLQIPPVVVLPPTNLHQVPSGTTNAIGIAWTASASLGVTDYLMYYGDTSTTTTNTTDLGNVTSTVISGLTSGETYFVSIVAISPNGQSSPADATITAQPDTSIGIIPLYDSSTPLEPDTIISTPTALITWIADRPRARHARECQFMLYNTYLTFYWEQRMTDIEIIDTFAQGGSNITFNMFALTALNTPNIRFFFQGETTVAQYSDNLFANSVDPTTLTNWTTTITQNTTFNRPIQLGDRIEFEFSPFMVAPTDGQNNYYGGAILYVVGRGIVPWQEGVTNDPQQVNAAIDSTPMPTNGWLAGGATMPYQYSCDTNMFFEQMAPNASPPTGQEFMLGRRLHHTDFLTGAHTEPGNPIFTNHVGQAGPMYIQSTCMDCHINNGRGFPAAVGQPLSTALIEVGSTADGAPDPVYGSVLLMQNVNGPGEGTATIASYTITTNTYGDGTLYTLQQPNYAFSPHTPAFYSVRFARPLVGLGLLEAIPESTVEAMSGGNNNGISGQIQTATDPWTGLTRLGRFGYKAAGFSVEHFVCAALNLELGVTTPIFPHNFNGPDSGGLPEVSADEASQWARYISTLGVNARRSLTDPQCLQGEALFASAGCAQCHLATLQTSPYHPFAELRNQTIHPYTDLLLHDMGPGLADNLNQGNASGAQWRTSPLWGIGLTPGVSGGVEAYLHDCRARSLAEAILWHGGEAEASEEAFRNMSASDRAALIAFLKSL